MMDNVVCPYTLLGEEGGVRGRSPIYATSGSACADLSLPEEVTVGSMEAKSVNLLISFQIPEGRKILMYPRSSLLAKKMVMSPVSVIDSDYDQPVFATLVNLGRESVTFSAGERVVQVECVPAHDCVSWARRNVRRSGGFGSTGER